MSTEKKQDRGWSIEEKQLRGKKHVDKEKLVEALALRRYQCIFIYRLFSEVSLETIFFCTFWIGKEEFHMHEYSNTN